MGVSTSGFDFKQPILNGQNAHIKGSSSEIKNKHVSLRLDVFFQAVSYSCSRGLIDDPQNIQPRNDSSIFGSLSLGVIEVGRNGNDCVLDGSSQVFLCDGLHFGKNHGRDLLWVEEFCFSFEFNLNHWFVVLSLNHLEGPEFHVLLNDLF